MTLRPGSSGAPLISEFEPLSPPPQAAKGNAAAAALASTQTDFSGEISVGSGRMVGKQMMLMWLCLSADYPI
jgi:hypothetical protein